MDPANEPSARGDQALISVGCGHRKVHSGSEAIDSANDGASFPAIDAVADPDLPDSLPQNALISRGACGAFRFEMYGDL